MSDKRDRLIANAQWWSGQCVDLGMDELACLLTDVANQMKNDRDADPKGATP